jgi:hypothetical protein
VGEPAQPARSQGAPGPPVVTIADALAFLRAARHDEQIECALEALGGKATWESLVETAARAGFSCTPEELQRAYALDWGMRWARYNRPAQ